MILTTHRIERPPALRTNRFYRLDGNADSGGLIHVRKVQTVKATVFRGQSRVSTWLMGIGYRVALKALRDGGPLAEPLASDYEGACVDPYADHELCDWVTKGLVRLPAEQQHVMEMAYLMRHSLKEIATMTDSPLSTVKARMFHARVKLRNLMPTLAGVTEGPQ